MAMLAGDSVFVRERIALYLDVNPGDPEPERFDFMHWLIHSWLGDTTQLARLRAHDALRDGMNVMWTLFYAVNIGFPLDDSEFYARRYLDEAFTAQERHDALQRLGTIGFIQGRVADALALNDSQPQPALPLGIFQLALAEQVSEYEARADSIVSRIEGWLADVGGPDSPEDWVYLHRLCHAELWHLSRGDTSRTRGRIQELRTAYAPAEPLYWHACPLLLEALLADGTEQADTTLERLDEFMRQGPPSVSGYYRTDSPHHLANLIIARLHARRGNAQAALAASRRVPHEDSFPRMLIPAYLRGECLSARAAGDPAGGIQACNHYLTLRPEPPTAEPLREQWEQVRDELAVLVGEREGRER
jgi:hypothetical protein